MQHTDADTGQSQFFQDSRQNDKRPENSSEDEVSIRRVLPDDGIFTNLVKDSISAQVRDGIRPMFVNNYYVGDNSWRPGVTEENTKAARQIDASTNRSSTAVEQTQSFRIYRSVSFQLILLDLVVYVYDVLFVLSNKYRIHSANWN